MAESLDIHITGRKGDTSLSLNNYDIKEWKEMIDVLVPLVSIDREKDDIVSIIPSEGSVRLSLQAPKHIIVKIMAVMALISETGSLKDADKTTKATISYFQNKATRYGYGYEFSSNVCDTKLIISPETNYTIPTAVYVPIEIYRYGQVVRLGGKEPKLEMEIATEGRISIQAEKEVISRDALLYKNWAVRISAKRDITTGEIDTNSYKLIEIVKHYTPKVDMKILNAYIAKATPAWDGVATLAMSDRRQRYTYPVPGPVRQYPPPASPRPRGNSSASAARR